MYLTALGRPPDDAELQAALAFVAPRARRASMLHRSAAVRATAQESSPEIAADLAVWTDFAHVLLNLKEFIFIP